VLRIVVAAAADPAHPLRVAAGRLSDTLRRPGGGGNGVDATVALLQQLAIGSPWEGGEAAVDWDVTVLTGDEAAALLGRDLHDSAASWLPLARVDVPVVFRAAAAARIVPILCPAAALGELAFLWRECVCADAYGLRAWWDARPSDGCRRHVVDVGANVGMCGLAAAATAPPGATFHWTAVEPIPVVARLLKANAATIAAAAPGLLTFSVVQAACVRQGQPASVAMTAFPTAPGNSFLATATAAKVQEIAGVWSARTAAGVLSTAAPPVVVDVTAVTLASLLGEPDSHSTIDFLKVDVEGSEVDVLDGLHSRRACSPGSAVGTLGSEPPAWHRIKHVVVETTIADAHNVVGRLRAGLGAGCHVEVAVAGVPTTALDGAARLPATTGGAGSGGHGPSGQRVRALAPGSVMVAAWPVA
jgi:FkbM family methyltransferase